MGKEQNNSGICPWCIGDEIYRRYHDQEWGVPCYDDEKLFEFLILESAQAGLNWLTILKRRDGYRNAFAQFSPQKVAEFSSEQVGVLLENPAIIRNQRKISSAIANAKAYLKVQEAEGSFARYLWSFTEFSPIQNSWHRVDEVPATTPISHALARDMKKRGFSFFGPTIAYAYLQAMGLVNDHLLSCPSYRACQQAGERAQDDLLRLKHG